MFNRPALLVLSAFVATSILSAGTGAIAATVITSANIKDDTIKPVDLAFPVGQEAEALKDADITLEKGFTKILSATYTNDDVGLATGYGIVEVENPTLEPIYVTVRMQHKGEPEHTTEFSFTLGPGETESAPASIRCDGFPAGRQTVIMSVSGQGASIADSSLSILATPQR